MAKASCVCGAVEFEVDGPPQFFCYCHCSRCRKRTGSIHAANMLVPLEGVRFLRGEEHVRTYELPDAPRWGNAFCTICGSPVARRSRDGRSWVVPSGAFDEDPGVRPDQNIFVGSKAPWAVDASSLPGSEEGPRPR